MKISALAILFVFNSLLTSAQSKMEFHEDTAQMRKEILSHIPIGTNILKAKQIMEDNKFSFYKEFINDEFLYHKNIDFLFFIHDKGVIFSMDRWKVGLVHKYDKVTEVIVQFVIISL